MGIDSTSNANTHRYFVLQPIHDLSRTVIGYEALYRSGWTNEFDGDSDAATVTGLIAAVGVTMPALITAPAAPVADAEELDDELDELDELLPQAARIDPSAGTEMPTTVARRMKSRRDSRPAANSSIMWFAISP